MQRGSLQIECPERTHAIVLLPLEAMLLIEVARRSVLLGRQEPAHQPPTTALGRAIGEVSEKRGFDGSSDNAAAKQESIHLALFTFVVRNRDPDQPMIAKTIAYLDRKYVPLRLLS